MVNIKQMLIQKWFLSVGLILLSSLSVRADNRASFHVNNAGSWFPRNLGTSLVGWFDGSDSSTLFQDTAGTTKAVNGNTVGLWKDKSGNHYDATQSTTAQQPTLTSQGLVFGGNTPQTNMTSTLTLTTFAPSNQGSMYAAMKMTGSSDPSSGVLNFRSVGYVDTGLIVGSNSTTFGMDWWNNGLYGWNVGDTFTAGAALVVGFVNSGASQIYTLNGTSYSNSIATTAPTAATPLVLGSDTQYPTQRFLNGTMYEAVIVNTALSVTNRQILEGYLAWKWGAQASLPGGHPYKHFAP
jgi:hypothetical protein